MIRSFLRRVLCGFERRVSTRHALPRLSVMLCSTRVDAADWSLGGFRLEDLPAEMFASAVPEPGMRIKGVVRFDSSVTGDFVAEIIAFEQGQLQARFLDISPGVFVAMAGLDSNG